MILRKTAIVIILLCSVFFSLFPAYKIFAQDSNAGFVPENIWFSKDPFEEGDKVKIYTVIFNPDIRELSGNVVFFDNNVFLGKKDFVASANGVKDVSLDWTVTVGTHSIFGKIENAKFLISPGKYEEVYLAENETSKSSRTVNKKIIVKAADTTDTNTNINSIINKAGDTGLDSVKNIGQAIEENTPNFISKPIIMATDAVETLRQNIATASKNKQEEVKKEIEILNANDTKSETEQSTKEMQTNELIKPLKFTELFALALFSNTFDNKFVFYTLLFLFAFLLLRYIVKRVR